MCTNLETTSSEASCVVTCNNVMLKHFAKFETLSNHEQEHREIKNLWL